MHDRIQTQGEKSRLEKDAEIDDLRSRVNKQDVRLESMQQLITSLEEKDKVSVEKLQKSEIQREMDLKKHVKEIEEKEKKLTEVFYARLDKKIKKLTQANEQDIKNIKKDHIQQSDILQGQITFYKNKIKQLE